MSKVVVDVIERTNEYADFINDLNTFHTRKGTTLRAEPVLGGKKIDLYKLYQAVVKGGGYSKITKKRAWKQIGNSFDLPSTCTNSAYILKGVYARNLVGYEEEKIWGEKWIVPEELKGPDAHKLSTLAGKSYKCRHKVHFSPYKQDIRPLLLPSLDRNQDKHACEISETHHRTQPSDHIHARGEVDLDCVTGTEFDEGSKNKIILSLESDVDINWALNYIVTISYESPDKLSLVDNLALLNILLHIVDKNITDNLFTVTASSHSHKVILKILHIFRNFSFIESNIRVFASNEGFKQMLIKCLVMKNPTHYSHCIDILENMAPFINLGPFDSIVGCLSNLLTTVSERLVILGALRILTLLANASSTNLQYLLLNYESIAKRAVELLILNDEELVGASLEYLVYYSKNAYVVSRYLLSLHNGADVGILVSLLVAPFKCFRMVLVDTFESPKRNKKLDSSLNNSNDDTFIERHASEPCIPNLTLYQQLDEPYRSLGWLKDKFEYTPGNNELSVDDIYTLYEIRFGHEKALKIDDFFTVLKIAFPTVINQTMNNEASIHGLVIRGLQVKMCILQDGSELMCLWQNCSEEFQTEHSLQNHVLQDHIGSYSENNCKWMDCDIGSNNQVELDSHIRQSHFSIIDEEIQGVALLAVQLLKILSQNPNSHMAFMPYESELLAASRKRPQLKPLIEEIFSNFDYSSSCSYATCSSSSSISDHLLSPC
ncbi:hypothetical protein K501DRAFT_219198 [Backusella circina FSU 941]|nr:hypothetical protein K501DRAFT_219198 [Backusella circina FSU 941]